MACVSFVRPVSCFHGEESRGGGDEDGAEREDAFVCPARAVRQKSGEELQVDAEAIEEPDRERHRVDPVQEQVDQEGAQQAAAHAKKVPLTHAARTRTRTRTRASRHRNIAEEIEKGSDGLAEEIDRLAIGDWRLD